MYLNDFLVHEASIDGFLPNSNDLTSIGKERSSYWPIQ
jgi:hypothetical protein